ncbi:predicted protein [Lichtheimia corymbifera JMRC:FSU:9682]|uniref:Uncharacterized protein n=1 Tax=Lichtheimia corymbifera JMRC:FSU:9682 TaxID=1263082 RepID=A0A068S7B1_9FUNG|nr:predicted protein [Lichtheimia corymbifera JMRC:FSU:9682]
MVWNVKNERNQGFYFLPLWPSFYYNHNFNGAVTFDQDSFTFGMNHHRRDANSVAMLFSIGTVRSPFWDGLLCIGDGTTRYRHVPHNLTCLREKITKAMCHARTTVNDHN